MVSEFLSEMARTFPKPHSMGISVIKKPGNRRWKLSIFSADSLCSQHRLLVLLRWKRWLLWVPLLLRVPLLLWWHWLLLPLLLRILLVWVWWLFHSLTPFQRDTIHFQFVYWLLETSVPKRAFIMALPVPFLLHPCIRQKVIRFPA